ncbi:MAG: Zn-dependent hydrolase [Spirochaetaceae bacterium]|nr:MAG: Zn-dependent hydrolase [Spirochaetaceae bacterium]
MKGKWNIDADHLMSRIETLAGFSDAPKPAVTRVLYTEQDLAARTWIKALFDSSGMTVTEDALGNTFARLEGDDPEAPAVATGSHIDAIPHSGRYDGTVGVLGAIEAVRAIQAAGLRLRRAIEIVLFTAEEPTRYGIGCLGSRAMSGILTPDMIRALRDEDDGTVEDARLRCGFTGPLESVRLERGQYHGFIELHIEQGPRLETTGTMIGNVTAIAAPATLHVTVSGEGGHAGAVLMRERHDALVAGAELAQAVEAAARQSGASDTVATVGIFDIHPRAVNSIPDRVSLTVDVRDIDGQRRDDTADRIRAAATDIGARRGVSIEVSTLNTDPPATCGPVVRDAIAQAAAELGHSCTDLVSRAYHDTLFMAEICPVGMIFVPCRRGVSHRPDEYSSPGQIKAGVEVLASTLVKLASQ